MSSSFFDLPFEEPASAEASASAERASADQTAGRDVPAAEPEPRRVLTVSQLTARIRTTLEEQFFEVWVEGEPNTD